MVVWALATIAGAGLAAASLLALAMLGLQFSIGALNDLVDAERDRHHKAGNPVAEGIVSGRAALLVAVAGGGLGLSISALHGIPVLLLAIAGYSCGLAYDLSLRARGLGWLCYAAAFPLLLAWTWLAAAGELPPGWQVLLPAAALAGPALNLSNALVDQEADTRSGLAGLAVRLGRLRGITLLAAILLVVHAAAWLTLAAGPAPTSAWMLVAASSGAAVLAVVLSASQSTSVREIGWRVQAVSVALLAVAWLLAIDERSP
jgi:heme o synthase